MDQDAVIELNDDTLECLKEQHMKSLVVMMFIESSEDDQETFKKLRNAFWREPILSFGVVNIRKASSWSDFAESSGAAAGSVLVWHPITKFQIIGSGAAPSLIPCSAQRSRRFWMACRAGRMACGQCRRRLDDRS